MNDFVIKTGIPSPETTKRPSITRALRALQVSQCFDVDYVRRRQLAWCVWNCKQQLPVRQFQTQVTPLENGDRVVRCWRLPDLLPSSVVPAQLHHFDEVKREALLMLEIGYNCGAFINVDMDDSSAMAEIKQFLDAEVKFPYQSTSVIRRVKGKRTYGILIWRTA